MLRWFVLQGALISVIALVSACGGRAALEESRPRDEGPEPSNGTDSTPSPPRGASSSGASPGVSPPRPAQAGMPSPQSPGRAPTMGSPPIDMSTPDVPRQDPISEPDPPECARGVVIEAFDQRMIDELQGCEVLPDGLHMVGGLDLSPLHALREVGGEGLSIADGIDLRGLENLQRATKLIISNFGISNLRELVSLQDVQWLEVRDSNLIDFQGLESVSGVSGLALYRNSRLSSLSGLSLSPEMSTLILEGNSQLRGIEELRAVTSVRGDLSITNTSIESLAPLENVGDSIGVVDISNNPYLRDGQGLGSVYSMTALYLRDNPSLETAPYFERLLYLDASIISNNAVLQVAAAFPSLGSISESLEVTFNPQLRSLELPALDRAPVIMIADNDSLASVAFDNLRESNQLVIFHNSSLDGAGVAASLSGVQCELVRIPSDQTVSSFSPCPWTLDNFCDSDLLCAPGTDPVCAQ